MNISEFKYAIEIGFRVIHNDYPIRCTTIVDFIPIPEHLKKYVAYRSLVLAKSLEEASYLDTNGCNQLNEISNSIWYHIVNKLELGEFVASLDKKYKGFDVVVDSRIIKL